MFFLSVICTAQEPGKGAVVAATNMNVLYMGLANPVEIAVPGAKSERVTAAVTNGKIIKTTNGWEVTLEGMGDCLITVLVDNKKVSEKSFRIKTVPAPVAVFAGMNSGTISREDVLKNAEIKVVIPDFVWDLNFTVESFTMTTSATVGDVKRVAKGNKLTDQMKADLARLTRDQKVIFEDIIAINPTGKKQVFAPIVLKIY